MTKYNEPINYNASGVKYNGVFAAVVEWLVRARRRGRR
jgi:hypothetical protein